MTAETLYNAYTSECTKFFKKMPDFRLNKHTKRRMIPNSEKKKTKQVIGDFWHTNLLHVGMQEQTFRAWILDQTNIPILKKTQQTTNSLEWYTKHIVWFKMLFKTTCWINNQNLAAEKKSPRHDFTRKTKKAEMWTTRKIWKKRTNQKSQAFHPLTTKNTNITQTNMKKKEKKNYNCATKWILNRSLNLHCCSSEEKSYMSFPVLNTVLPFSEVPE